MNRIPSLAFSNHLAREENWSDAWNEQLTIMVSFIFSQSSHTDHCGQTHGLTCHRWILQYCLSPVKWLSQDEIVAGSLVQGDTVASVPRCLVILLACILPAPYLCSHHLHPCMRAPWKSPSSSSYRGVAGCFVSQHPFPLPLALHTKRAVTRNVPLPCQHEWTNVSITAAILSRFMHWMKNQFFSTSNQRQDQRKAVRLFNLKKLMTPLRVTKSHM